MGSPVSLANCSRMCRVGLGVCEKAFFKISNCLALMVVRGPRRLDPAPPSSGDLDSDGLSLRLSPSPSPSTEPATFEFLFFFFQIVQTVTKHSKERNHFLKSKKIAGYYPCCPPHLIWHLSDPETSVSHPIHHPDLIRFQTFQEEAIDW